jgi:3-methyladenine DNA glycosylase AlkD
MRQISARWTRDHRGVTDEDLSALFEALWSTGWREERIVAMGILGRGRRLRDQTAWADVARWSRDIDNWELVDHMAGAITGPMLVANPELIASVEALSASDHSWQRRLAVVTLIEAARDDPAWAPYLAKMCERLKGDRGPTMRKALDWGRRTVNKVQAREGAAIA